MSQNLFDARFLLLLDARLTFHMVNEQIGGIVQYRFVFVRKNEMRSMRRII